jgi:hypothetical protein
MTFFEILTKAVNDIIENGYDSEERIKMWMDRIYKSAMAELIPEAQIQQELEKALRSAFHRLVTKGGLAKGNISKFDVSKLTPKLQSELNRRIVTSSNLIKLNREETINSVLRRFEGWATSIPPGGSKVVDRVQQKKDIRKSLGKIGFEQRRVIIDQTHKLIANINDIVAVENGAIAGKWHSHWKQINYNYRKDHKERDEKIYVIRGSWADKQGYLEHPYGYTDEITQPGEEVYCRCNYVYLYNLKQCKNILTKKGEIALQSIKTK